jgi:hypothetical protein
MLKVESYEFGRIVIDGREYTKDIIIDRKKISKRNKKASKDLKSSYGHTPLSIREHIPWECHTLVIGRGMYGALPVMGEVKREADKRGVELILCSTGEAIDHINDKATNLILHLTC